MKSPLKVGERVAVYNERRDVGTVTHIALDGNLGVSFDTPGAYSMGWFHPKQCRRLKKRERRRVWVESHRVNEALATSVGVSASISGRRMCEGDVEFIEVLPKKERK